MNEILAGLDGVLCQMEDVLVLSRNQAEHDQWLHVDLMRIEKQNLHLTPKIWVQQGQAHLPGA